MLTIINEITFIAMGIGLLATIYDTLKKKQFLQTLLVIIVPFYVFYYILKLPESNFKKIVAILCIGSFWIFFFVGILNIVFTPPQ